MKFILIVVVTLSLFLAVVSAERVKDEEVAVIESVERALIMEAFHDELAQVSSRLQNAFLMNELIGREQVKRLIKTKPKVPIKKPPAKIKPPPQKTVYCRENDKSFTLSKLQEYLKTITGEVRGRGFIFIPPGQSSVASNGVLINSRISTKAEQAVFPNKTSTHVECKLTRIYNTPGHMVREFYMNLSPCTSCAPQLLKAYNGIVSPANPVTIHLSRLWTGSNDDYKQCLAKLIKKGFKLVLANWYFFAVSYLKDVTCIDEAYNFQNREDLKSQGTTLEEAINKAEALAKKTSDSAMNGWCPETPNWCD